MLLIVLFFWKLFYEEKTEENIYLPDLIMYQILISKRTEYSWIGIFVLNQEQLKNFFPTKTGEAFAHLDEGDTILNWALSPGISFFLQH